MRRAVIAAVSAGLIVSGAQAAQAAPVAGAVTAVKIVEAAVKQYAKTTVSFAWRVPSGTEAGDTFTIQLPEIFNQHTTYQFDLPDEAGVTVATAAVAGRSITVTMSEFVASHEDVHGTAELNLYLDTAAVTPDTTYDVEFHAAGATFTDTVTIEPVDPAGRDQTARKWMTLVDEPTDAAHQLNWGIVGPRIEGNRRGAVYTFVDRPEAGQELTCGSKTYANIFLEVGDRWENSDVVNVDHAALKYVPKEKWTWSCTPSQMSVTFDTAAYPEYDGLIPYVVGWSSITDPALSSYTNRAVVSVGSAFSKETQDTAYRLSGSGTGTGSTPTAPVAPPVAPPVSEPVTPPSGQPVAPPVTSPVAPPSVLSTPTPTSPPTPAAAPSPTPTKSPSPTKSPAHLPTLSKPAIRYQLRTFQIDTYRTPTPAQRRLLNRILGDRQLHYREDRLFWGHSSWEFVTIKAPVEASDTQLLKAINQASRRSADVRTLHVNAPAGRQATLAWELGKGATARYPWGRAMKTAQTFFARS